MTDDNDTIELFARELYYRKEVVNSKESRAS